MPSVKLTIEYLTKNVASWSHFHVALWNDFKNKILNCTKNSFTNVTCITPKLTLSFYIFDKGFRYRCIQVIVQQPPQCFIQYGITTHFLIFFITSGFHIRQTFIVKCQRKLLYDKQSFWKKTFFDTILILQTSFPTKIVF